jgi:predicted metal-dependent HD superfamily phosphohydrolase
MHAASDLHDRWMLHAKRLAVGQNEAEHIWQELCHAYASPPRAYHNLTHIAACLRDLGEAAPEGSLPIETAIWFHDSIYEALCADNEARSAEFMRTVLGPAGVRPQILYDAHRLIMVTAGHTTAIEEDELLTADIDLAVLAVEPMAYDRYAEAIRSEYRTVPDDQYSAGRARFLTSMLGSPTIYRTSWAIARDFNARARANLSRELNRLYGQAMS